MKIHIITVGNKQSDWINRGFQEYAKRLNQEVTIQLKEIVAVTHYKNMTADEIKQKEADKIRSAIPKNTLLIVLDERGRSLTSKDLACEMQQWLDSGQDVSLVIGGAEGLEKTLIDEADNCWSLSAFTLPHGLVRILIAEQIYRAWSILKCHPYHRS